MQTPSRTHDPRVPTPFDRLRLSVATLGTSDGTIVRAYRDPSSVRQSTLLRLAKAACELGLQGPESATKVLP